MGTCTYGSGADMGKPAIGIWYGALCRAYKMSNNNVSVYFISASFAPKI